MSFTGNKDTDFLVLNQITDNDLAAVCSVNKYAKKLCEDEGFWKRRLFSNSIISNLEKEYVDAGHNFENKMSFLKNFLEFEKWKDLYLFLFLSGDNYQQENLKELLRNSILRFHNYSHSKFLEDLEKIDDFKNVPKWLNVTELKKDIIRKYFWKLSRGSWIANLKTDIINDFIYFLNKYEGEI